MRRARFPHPFEWHAQHIAAFVSRAPCLEQPGFLFFRPINSDTHGSERIAADIELGMRQRAERCCQLFEFVFQELAGRAFRSGGIRPILRAASLNSRPCPASAGRVVWISSFTSTPNTSSGSARSARMNIS